MLASQAYLQSDVWQHLPKSETDMTSDAQILASSASARETSRGAGGSSPLASTPGGAVGSSPVPDTADPRRWLTLLILLLAAFMNLLDGNYE